MKTIETITKNIEGKRTKFEFKSEDENYIYFSIDTKMSHGANKFPKTHCKDLKECVQFYIDNKGNLNKVLKDLKNKQKQKTNKMKKEKSLIEKSKEISKTAKVNGKECYKAVKVVTNYKGRKSFYMIQRATAEQKANHLISCRSGVEVAKSSSLTNENSTSKTYETDAKFEKAIQRIQRIKRKSIPVVDTKEPAKKEVAKKPVAKKPVAKKPTKKAPAKMSEQQIKERIAESGKMTIKDVVSYFKKYEGQFDPTQLKSIAKEMIAEAKKQIAK
jgi:hypothetical protein